MLMLIFPIAALAKTYQFTSTDATNFGIMKYILNILQTGNEIGMKSFDFPAKVYSLVYFLGFKTHLEWSVFYTIIFTIILFGFLLRYKKYTNMEYVYIYSSMFILCWTVMNMNKDLIQLMFMLITFAICSSKLKNKNKILLSSGIFLFESVVFRDYYILVAVLSVLVYLIIDKELKTQKKRHYMFDILIIFISFFIGVYICKYVAPDAYDQLINRREELINRDDVTTIIQNLIPGQNFFVYICNYFINFIRILFPVEIIRFGFKYIVFFLYQIITTGALIISLKKINKANIVYISVVIAYYIMLAASESDFGTLVRHQSVLFLFYIALFKGFTNKDVSKNE